MSKITSVHKDRNKVLAILKNSSASFCPALKFMKEQSSHNYITTKCQQAKLVIN